MHREPTMRPARRIARGIRVMAVRRRATDLLVPFLMTAALLIAFAQAARATEIQKVVSESGIEAWLVEEHSLPILSIEFAFKGGAIQDPDGKEGVANLVSGLLDEGAGEMDSSAFQAKLQDLSVRLSFTAGRDGFYGSFKTLTGNRAEAIELLRLAITSPRFDAEPVERIRAQIISGLRRESRDPEKIAAKLWFRTAFPSHPYGRPSKGDESSVSSITRADLVAFHTGVFARDNLKIAVVGDIDAATLKNVLDQTFSGLPDKADLRPVAAVEPRDGISQNQELPVPQTVIRFGGPGIGRKDPDFIAAYIMNHILGGGSFSSRLYQEVREKRGLAYSVYTYLAPLDFGPVFLGGLATRADQAKAAIELIRSEVKRMAKDGPTADELEKAKAFLIGSYPLRFDSSSKIANQLVSIQVEGLGIDYIKNRNDLIAAVTIDDVRRAAQRLLGQAGLVISTVGKIGG